MTDEDGPGVDEAVHAALVAFEIQGDCVDLRPHVRGHIHDTFVSTFECGDERRRFLHQRLNEHVFTDVPALMHNVQRITAHLAGKEGLEALELVPTRSGRAYHRAADGPWRTYRFVEGTETYDRCTGPDQAFEAARAFGGFQAALADLPPDELRETIPSFFSGPHRMRQLADAIAADPLRRSLGAAPELHFAREREDLANSIESRLAAGTLPRRVVHGDTKLNNVLFDATSGRARCVVDLDTAMPGWSLYDYGDLVRFTAATCAEDEPDPELAGVDPTLYRAISDGWREGTATFQTAVERRLMPLAARLVTFMIGVRFLTDHLLGDVYFRVAREDHNLARARVQFRMVAELEAREAELAT